MGVSYNLQSMDEERFMGMLKTMINYDREL